MTAAEHHRIAERLSQAAYLAARRGHPQFAACLYGRAAKCEAAALARMSDDKPRTRRTLESSHRALLAKAVSP